MSRTLFISAGMLRGRKFVNPVASLNLYHNFGLLGLASVVETAGIPSVVVHGHFDDPAVFATQLFRAASSDNPVAIFLSIPTYYALTWAKEFIASVRILAPETVIVAGGRWGLGEDPVWIRRQLPNVDLLVFGTAENRIVSIVKAASERGRNIAGDGIDLRREAPLERLPDLNYRLMPDHENYHPSLELSRGCGLGCAFCVERDKRLEKMRAPNDVISSLKAYQSLYAGGELRPYFEASFFRPTEQWTEELVRQWRESRPDIEWRCETRVDSISPAMLTRLARCGLKVIDLGLESASRQQLLRMQKTRNPDEYLKRASALLNACASEGVWAKVNVLLYAGETDSTLRETLEFIERHSHAVKGVSVNPLVVFRAPGVDVYLSSLKTLGAQPVDESALDTFGYAEMHLSKWFSHEQASAEMLTISKSLMTSRSYYDLKSFSYFRRGLTYAEFLNAASEVPSALLPFHVD